MAMPVRIQTRRSITDLMAIDMKVALGIFIMMILVKTNGLPTSIMVLGFKRVSSI